MGKYHKHNIRIGAKRDGIYLSIADEFVGSIKVYSEIEAFADDLCKNDSRFMKIRAAPAIPYAVGWDGASNFSKNMCSGNYWYGAKLLHGKYSQVKLDVLDFYPNPLPVWSAIEDCSWQIWHGYENYKFEVPAGTIWTSYRDHFEKWYVVKIKD